MQRLRSECISCILDKHLTAYPEETSEKDRVAYMQRLLGILAAAPLEHGAPQIMEDVEDLQKEMFGREARYAQIKRHFNDVMLGYVPEVKAELEAADDPLALAVHYALSGNYIDFGAMQHVDEEKLRALLREKTPLDSGALARFRQSLKAAHRLLYITDNCGEIVMDGLLMDTIVKLFPQISVKVMVRGGEVLNDAAMEDADQVGLTARYPVIGNGTRVAGTCTDRLEGEALEAWEEADIILAKGQGNFETLRLCGRNVYYLFLCKCPMFARTFHVPRFTGMLLHDSEI